VICEELARAFDVPQAAATLFERDGSSLVVVAEYCAQGRPSALGAVIAVADNYATQYVLTHRTPLAIVDAQTDPRQASFHDLARLRGTASLLIVPLMIRDRLIGTLGLDAIERREFSADEIALAQTVAAAASRALENAYLHEDIQRELADRRRAEETFHTLLESAPDAIIISDTADLIVMINTQTERLFGYPRDELVGRQRDLVLLGSGPAVPVEGAAPVVKPARDLVARRKDGSTFPADVSVGSLRIEDGSLVMSTVRDITERKQVERLKDEFIATVSHELRTPLTSIRGALGLIAGGVAGDLPDQLRQLIEIAHSNSVRLVRLVNDILDIEKIETGQIPFALRPIELVPLVEQALAANQADADQFGVRFVLHHGPSDLEVVADHDRLTQVLTNLLSNAAKFSPRGSKVDISVSRLEHMLRIAVCDRGSRVIPAGGSTRAGGR
jgi:PAS domain S-box-containing protein